MIAAFTSNMILDVSAVGCTEEDTYIPTSEVVRHHKMFRSLGLGGGPGRVVSVLSECLMDTWFEFWADVKFNDNP